MNTKRCSKCGWEFPATYKSRKCKFCGGPFANGYCSRCKEWSESLNPLTSRCRKCETELHAAWRANRRSGADSRFQEWTKQISSLPSPALTEAEWLDACKHFGGCAYCGSPDIDARSLFIPFKNGGRYTAWNVIPACEKCEASQKVTKNPFIRMDSIYNRAQATQAKKYGLTLDNLQRIIDYLQTKMGEQ